jgi:hypothetical protein
MKAQDLRIGNLVWNDTQDMPVTVNIKILSEQLYREKKGVGLWKPIPLTEEWLWKFGFLFNGHTWQGSFDDANSEWFFKNGEFYDYDEFITRYKRISYVHSLQNLIFAITGEELKIK